MMKKGFSALCALVLMLSLVGCGSAKTAVSTAASAGDPISASGTVTVDMLSANPEELTEAATYFSSLAMVFTCVNDTVTDACVTGTVRSDYDAEALPGLMDMLSSYGEATVAGNDVSVSMADISSYSSITRTLLIEAFRDEGYTVTYD